MYLKAPADVDVRSATEQIAQIGDPVVRVDDLARGDQFFSVVNSAPENHCLVAQAHVAPETDTISVKALKASPGDGIDDILLSDAAEPSILLHLSAWCDSAVLPGVLSSMAAFEASISERGSARHVTTPANFRPLGLWPEVARPPLADADAEEVVADALVLVAPTEDRFQRIVQELAQRGEMRLMDLDNVHACDLDTLMEAGIIESEERDFGEVTYKIRPAAVEINLELAHRRIGLVAQMPAKCVPWRMATRIDLDVELLRLGWRYGDTRGLNPRHLDTPLVLNEQWVLQSKARLAALLNHLEISLKGLSEIYLTRPQHYYVCLLGLEDLSILEGLGAEVENKSDAYFRDILMGRAPALLALPDAGDGEPLALPAAPPAVGREPIPLLDVARPDFGRLPLQQQLGDGRTVTIHVDALSHATRRPRALTMCTLHKKCRLDRFIHVLGSQQRTCAFLLAWHELGSRFPDAEMHKVARPEDPEVDRWENTFNDPPA